MSFEKIAKILHVDEVQVNHGPKGVAVHVRIEKSWHSSAIDNELLGKHKMEVIAKHLAHLADANVGRMRDSLHKSQAMIEGATRAAMAADEAANRRRPTWGDVPFDRPYDGAVQVQRTEPVFQPPAPPPILEPVASEPMPSRFHAILAELRCL